MGSQRGRQLELKNVLERLKPPEIRRVEVPIGLVPTARTVERVVKKLSEMDSGEFMQWLKEEYTKDKEEVLKAKRSDFLEAMMSSYKLGRLDSKKR